MEETAIQVDSLDGDYSDVLEEIELLIDSLFDTGNIKAIIIANEDGLPIASKIFMEEPNIEYILSAVLSTLVNTGGRMSERLGMGEPTDIKMNLELGVIMVRTIRDRSCCGIVLPKDVNIPFFEIKLEELAKKVVPILYEEDE